MTGVWAERVRQQRGPFYEHVTAGRYKAAKQVLREWARIDRVPSYDLDYVLVTFDEMTKERV